MTASTAITPFNFNEHAVRVIQIEDAPWFVATDVAESLGYKSPKDAASYLDDDEKGSAIVRTPGGDQKLTVINESGLYALVLRSRKPEARKFAKWVTSEVLPAIRKTGKYERPHNPAIDYDRISPAQAQDLKELVHAIADAKVQGFAETWARLHRKFRVNSYLELPAAKFDDARDYLLGKLPNDAAPIDPTNAPAMVAAHRVAIDYMNNFRASVREGKPSPSMGEIPTAVLQGILSEAIMRQRMLVSFNPDTGRIGCTVLGGNEFISDWPRLVKDVATGECMRTSAELLDMAAACMQRLQRRGGPARLAA